MACTMGHDLRCAMRPSATWGAGLESWMARAKLPALGEWDGLIHGDLGVLETDGEHVCCHACAGWFKALAQHARQTHRLTPDEYRAIFGLNASTPLDAPTLRAIKRRNSAPILARYRPLNEDALRQQTTEDRRAQASGGCRRASTHTTGRSGSACSVQGPSARKCCGRIPATPRLVLRR